MSVIVICGVLCTVRHEAERVSGLWPSSPLFDKHLNKERQCTAGKSRGHKDREEEAVSENLVYI